MYQNKDFDHFLEKIRSGEDVRSYELAPFLKTQAVADRITVNRKLAETYLEAGKIETAQRLIRRVFVLSGFSAELLPLYNKIFELTKNADAVKFAYKRVGIKSFTEGRITEALNYFDKWQYVHASQFFIDKYDFDYDILQTIESYAGKNRLSRDRQPADPSGKIKIGYVPVHFLDPGSVLIKLDKLFAKYHDRNKFEVCYFVPEAESDMRATPHGPALHQYFTDQGCRVVYMNSEGNPDITLINFAKHIADAKMDVLVTGAALSAFKNYFIASFRPAPLMIAIVHGPVAQYVTGIFDYAINSFDMHQTDTPCDAEQINIELDVKTSSSPEKATVDFGVPEDGVVLLCGGRLTKFQNRQYWQSLFRLIIKYPDAYLFVIGFTKEMFPFKEMLSPGVLKKATFFQWTAHYDEMLMRADIYIDGYPMGGGVLMMEIMSRGVPVVSFEHDFLQLFDGSEGSASSEISGIPETYVQRENFTDFESKISSLIRSKEMRTRIGAACKEQVLAHRSSPARMVKKYEDVYRREILKTLRDKKTPVHPDDDQQDILRNIKFSRLAAYFLKTSYLRIKSKLRRSKN